MKVVISNLSPPVDRQLDFEAEWARHEMPPPQTGRRSLFEQKADWGFHICAIGVYLLDCGAADRVELWEFGQERTSFYLSNGILKTTFFNPSDVAAYLQRYGDPDLFINYGRHGAPLLEMLEGRSFRVDVPCLRVPPPRGELLPAGNRGAECYLVDSEEFLDSRSMMYVPVVNTTKFHPANVPKQRDFIYLASCYEGKRHDIAIRAAQDSGLIGHFHPVESAQLELGDANITTSGLNERNVVELLQTSRIAIYPGDQTSNPAAMWECVATGLPIVVNEKMEGGKHVVVPGITGELASEKNFADTMRRVLREVDRYRPREHFVREWDTLATIRSYLAFIRRMGWRG